MCRVLDALVVADSRHDALSQPAVVRTPSTHLAPDSTNAGQQITRSLVAIEFGGTKHEGESDHREGVDGGPRLDACPATAHTGTRCRGVQRVHQHQLSGL